MQKDEHDGRMRVKGYGLLVYSGMVMVSGGMLAERSPLFIVVAVLGFVGFICGLWTMVKRVSLARAARRRLRSDAG